MKSFNLHSLTVILFSVSVISLAGCGGSEAPKETETAKPSAADMFKDDRPAYDAAAISPDAEVISIDLKATGNTMADISYDQKILTVKAGTTIKLKFTNTSTDAAMPHNWVLVHNGTMEAVATAGLQAGPDAFYVPNSKDVLIATRMLGPTETSEITFPAPPAGKYQFVCTYPGHWSIMNGEFIVE